MRRQIKKTHIFYPVLSTFSNDFIDLLALLNGKHWFVFSFAKFSGMKDED